jgi:uncharacterized protein YdhG (YjbR/CyaY superfamily)
MNVAKEVDRYIAKAPAETHAGLARMREAIRATAPTAVESVAYGMPAYKYEGKPLVYFAAAKQHVGLYGPAVVEFEGELKGYSTSKGTVRFPLGKPVPVALVKKLVKARMAAIDDQVAAKKTSSTKKKSSITKKSGVKKAAARKRDSG